MVQSIDRAMSIIQILVSDPGRMEWSITDLAEETHLPVSTLHRLLSSLIKHGLVMQNRENKYYRVGYTWMEIGLRVMENLDFRDVARSVMERLALEVEESIYLNIPHGTDGIVIEKVDSPLKVRIAESLGIRIPLHIGAPNKVILAYMKDQERENLIAQLLRDKKDKQDLIEQLARIQQQGLAISRGEKTEGTISIAAPVKGYQQKIIAAMSINAPSFRITEDRMPQMIECVKKATEEVSYKLGGF